MGARNQVDRERWARTLDMLGVKGRRPDGLTEELVNLTRRKPLGERYSLADGEVHGMSLLVGATGEGTFWLHYRTKDEKRRQYKIGRSGSLTLEEARIKARAAIAKVESGGDPAAEEEAARQASMTLQQYMTEVYEPRIMSTWAMTTAWTGKHRIKAAWEGVLDSPLNKIDKDTIEAVLKGRRSESASDRTATGKFAPATILRDWALLRAVLKHAVKTGHLEKMPLAAAPEAVRGLVRNKRIRYLGQLDTEEEIAAGNRGERARFMAALEAYESPRQWGGDFIRTVVKLALCTGMRRTEILKINVSMIDWRKQTITLPASVTKAKKERTVHLNADAAKALKDWPHRDLKGNVFPGSIWVLWSRITSLDMPQLCAMAHVKNFHFHDCRHDFASRLAMAGTPLLAIKEALGHASIQMTERYAHLCPSVTRDAVRGLAAL